MWLMWQSATSATVTMLPEQHLFVGGLGGVIAVIGGIISIITFRANRRGAARPAIVPRAAEPDHPSSVRPAYAEPAPPTSPARRLHPGPISMSAPKRPDGSDDDRPHISTSLFDPDLQVGAPTGQETETLAELRDAPPILRPSSYFSAAWRAQTAPIQESEPAHAPIWNRSPFLRPESATQHMLNGAASPTSDLMSAPPVWRTSGARALFGLSSSTDAQTTAQADSRATTETPAQYTSAAPVWSSWLRPRAADPMRAAEREAARLDEHDTTTVEPEPPIWPSRLLKPE